MLQKIHFLSISESFQLLILMIKNRQNINSPKLWRCFLNNYSKDIGTKIPPTATKRDWFLVCKTLWEIAEFLESNQAQVAYRYFQTNRKLFQNLPIANYIEFLIYDQLPQIIHKDEFTTQKIQSLQKACFSDPKFIRAQIQLAKLESCYDQEIIQTLIAHHQTKKRNPKSEAERLSMLAQLHLQIAEYEIANQYCDQVIKINPNTKSIYQLKSQIIIHLSLNLDQKINFIMDCLKIDPSNQTIRFNLAKVAIEANDYHTAHHYFNPDHFEPIDPKNESEARLLKAVIHFHLLRDPSLDELYLCHEKIELAIDYLQSDIQSLSRYRTSSPLWETTMKDKKSILAEAYNLLGKYFFQCYISNISENEFETKTPKTHFTRSVSAFSISISYNNKQIEAFTWLGFIAQILQTNNKPKDQHHETLISKALENNSKNISTQDLLYSILLFGQKHPENTKLQSQILKYLLQTNRVGFIKYNK